MNEPVCGKILPTNTFSSVFGITLGIEPVPLDIMFTTKPNDADIDAVT